MVCYLVLLSRASTESSSRQERLQKQLTEMTISDGKRGSVIRVEDVINNCHSLGNAEHIVQEIHDILISYYNLAQKRFVDNIRMQVVDHFLVAGPETPLKLFSPTFITAMSSEQLEDVAGEDQSVRRLRTDLEKEIELLENARRILQ